MQILNVIEKHHVKFRHTLGYRLYHDHKSITLSDQDEACKDPWKAYEFASFNIPGTDIAKCQRSACVDGWHAYYFAISVSGADLAYCRKICSSSRFWIKEIDKMITDRNANTKYHQKAPG